MRVNSGGFYMFSRRGFLIGAGSLLTAAFVSDARAVASKIGKPLLAPPPQAAQTMYWYDGGEQGFMLTIGAWEFCPPPPTWREFFASEGIAHDTDAAARRAFEKFGFERQDCGDEVDGWFWETRFDLETGPCARAYHLLRKLDLGPAVRRGSDDPRLIFYKGDVSDDDSRWVNARDELALSTRPSRPDLEPPRRSNAGAFSCR
jgi:hypothetical protein